MTPTQYNQEIFDFFVVRDHFETMVRTRGYFTSVKEQLLQTFWNAVSAEIETRLPVAGSHWRLYNPGNKEHSHAKLLIHKDAWRLNPKGHPIAGIAWERMFTFPYYGVWYDHENKPGYCNALKNEFEQLRRKMDFKSDPAWWPFWSHARFNFNVDEDLLAILPDNRAMLVVAYAENLVSLLPDVEGIIDGVIAREGASTV